MREGTYVTFIKIRKSKANVCFWHSDRYVLGSIKEDLVGDPPLFTLIVYHFSVWGNLLKLLQLHYVQVFSVRCVFIVSICNGKFLSSSYFAWPVKLSLMKKKQYGCIYFRMDEILQDIFWKMAGMLTKLSFTIKNV